VRDGDSPEGASCREVHAIPGLTAGVARCFVHEPHALEQLFRHTILKLLLSEGRITAATVALMAKWRHSAKNKIFEDSGVFDGFVR
jgi:hypothetical protein